MGAPWLAPAERGLPGCAASPTKSCGCACWRCNSVSAPSRRSSRSPRSCWGSRAAVASWPGAPRAARGRCGCSRCWKRASPVCAAAAVGYAFDDPAHRCGCRRSSAPQWHVLLALAALLLLTLPAAAMGAGFPLLVEGWKRYGATDRHGLWQQYAGRRSWRTAAAAAAARRRLEPAMRSGRPAGFHRRRGAVCARSAKDGVRRKPRARRASRNPRRRCCSTTASSAPRACCWKWRGCGCSAWRCCARNMCWR